VWALTLVTGVSLASSILEVSERHDLGVAGTFARPVRLDGGWWLTWGAGGDLVRVPLIEDYGWWAPDRDRVSLLGRSDLVDHALVPCPDGSWLHVGSAGVLERDDSSYVHWLDPDLVLVDEAVIEEAAPERVHNDPAVVCGEDFVGVAHTGPEPLDPSWFFTLQDGEVGAPQELEGSPRTNGAGLLEVDGELVLVGAWGYVSDLQVNVYGEGLALVDGPHRRAALGDDEGIWWPTGVVRVGDHLLVATMGKGLDDAWTADTGQVWLLVLDADHEVVEEVQVSQLSLPEGAMRPWLTLDGDRLLVTADVEVQPVLWEVRLDLDALAGDPGSPGDSGDVEDTGGEASRPPPRAEAGCGCSGPIAPVGPWAWAPWLAALGRRRRTPAQGPRSLASLLSGTSGSTRSTSGSSSSQRAATSGSRAS